jgi:hypothetical protein
MKVESRQSGMTLTELIVVTAGIILLAVLGLPAVRALVHSFESGSGTRAMIGSALASARALAAREQRYVGVRFQKAYNPDPLKAPQYMIFVIHDFPQTNLANGFRAIEGIKPMKLPDSVGVTDLMLGSAGDASITSDLAIDEDWEVVDASTFTIVFSPAGKLVLHEVRAAKTGAGDDMFNIETSAASGAAMFVEDAADEMSRTHFVIYDSQKFEQAYRRTQAYSGYLLREQPPAIYINAYTGTLISTE